MTDTAAPEPNRQREIKVKLVADATLVREAIAAARKAGALAAQSEARQRPYATAHLEAQIVGTPYWVIALASELRYTVAEPGERADLRLLTLDNDPFTIIGRLVIVTHLILDNEGNCTRNIFGRRRRRHELRLLPRSPYRKD